MINKTVVYVIYDKHLDEATKMMLNLIETDEKKKLFLKPSEVTFDNFLKDYYTLLLKN